MNIVIPELSLRVSASVSEGNCSSMRTYPHSPTLMQLRFICRYVKKHNIPFYSERGEWTADFVDMNNSFVPQVHLDKGYIYALYISNPNGVHYIKGSWIADGGVKTLVVLPPNGWVISNEQGKLYDEKTGLPLRTTNIMTEAIASNYSYFWRGEQGQGLLAVNRECERIASDAFEVSIIQSPDFMHENIGSRNVIRIIS